MSYGLLYDSSRLREMWLPLFSDSLPGSKQLLVGASDELDSKVESKVAEGSLAALAWGGAWPHGPPGSAPACNTYIGRFAWK